MPRNDPGAICDVGVPRSFNSCTPAIAGAGPCEKETGDPGAVGVTRARSGAEDGIDFGSRRLDTGAMGVRTRGLDIKAGAAKLKADRAARLEAELVVDRWNRRLATGRDMLW